MKTLFAALLLAAEAARAQPLLTTGPTPAAFVPAGYRVLPDGQATGDLNGDGQSDMVLTLGPVGEEAENASEAPPPRLLLVLWGTAAGGYRLAAQSRQMLGCRHCGGGYADPFDGVEITKGVLYVRQRGARQRRWKLESRFQYRQQRLVLAGESSLSARPGGNCEKLAWPPASYYRDTNFVTGEYERVNVSEGCELLEHRRGQRPVEPLLPLADYKPAF